ncbi:hypothetical protein PoB_003555300 [Plakobranchus ocellatus]|uniref:Uncharacterized protein n=1 Tax=Plakobranchus ocellatus TaxID=259542 RepID=A0AAV4AQF2_9GAST|nr:hypothetical protein PoB_003555300 [Plakobranchus ocellatus]
MIKSWSNSESSNCGSGMNSKEMFHDSGALMSWPIDCGAADVLADDCGAADVEVVEMASDDSGGDGNDLCMAPDGVNINTD